MVLDGAGAFGMAARSLKVYIICKGCKSLECCARFMLVAVWLTQSQREDSKDPHQKMKLKMSTQSICN